MAHPFLLCALWTIFFLLLRGGLEIIIISPARDDPAFMFGVATIGAGVLVLSVLCSMLVMRNLARIAD